MTDCAVIGDSIAVGIWWHRQECAAHARVGIAAAAFTVAPRSSREVVISLGSNDAADPTAALIRVRQGITAERVVWIVPVFRHGDAVRHVAALFKDETVEFPVGPDGIHPADYSILAEQTRRMK